MNPDGGVEVRLRRPGFHRYRQALDDLRGPVACHVTADHSVVRRIDDQLHDCVFVSFAQGQLQRREDRFVDPDVLATVPRLGFGEKRTDYYTATGTFSYKLTERLMARFEARYDKIFTDDDRLKPFDEHQNDGSVAGIPIGDQNDAIQGIVEVTYSFD